MSFGLVANLAALMTFAATLSETAGEWRLSASQSGWIGGIYFAGYGVAVPFLASASDRMDGRRLYVASALIRAAANLAFALFASSDQSRSGMCWTGSAALPASLAGPQAIW